MKTQHTQLTQHGQGHADWHGLILSRYSLTEDQSELAPFLGQSNNLLPARTVSRLLAVTVVAAAQCPL